MLTDFLLIQKMKQGDEQAFDVFVRKYYDDILKYCCCHSCDTEYAEDLTQETFVNFFAKLSDYHFRDKTKNYLYTIAGNLCKNYYKKKKEIPLEEEMQNSSPSNDMEQVLDKLLVESAIHSLPEEFQEIVILYYFQELKIAEIAKLLQISTSLVKYRLTQSRKYLESFFRKEDAYGLERTNKNL